MNKDHVPYLPPERPAASLVTFTEFMKTRRSVRHFSATPVPLDVLLRCLEVAGSAPSGANSQPWFFAVIESAEIKKLIRAEAEKVEKKFYAETAPKKWLEDLKPLGTNEEKPYLTEAGALIAVFSRRQGPDQKSYYPVESTGIATGFLLAALHHAGLSTLTHTPRPMGFLNEILELDESYRPFMLIAAGYPAPRTMIPALSKKLVVEISRFY